MLHEAQDPVDHGPGLRMVYDIFRAEGSVEVPHVVQAAIGQDVEGTAELRVVLDVWVSADALAIGEGLAGDHHYQVNDDLATGDVLGLVVAADCAAASGEAGEKNEHCDQVKLVFHAKSPFRQDVGCWFARLFKLIIPYFKDPKTRR